jgi:hypothetical protein
MQKLDNPTTRRLAFIKWLYTLGVEQSKWAEPMQVTSVLTIHDAIELFFELASEHLDVGKRQIEFMDYWDLLSKKLPQGGLSQKESIRRLNKSRVALKHHGTMPSRLDVEAFRASATNFFEENTPKVFGLEFTGLSLVDLVVYENARERLKEAEREIETNKIEQALSQCSLAFHQLVDDYENRKRSRFGVSPFLSDEIDRFGKQALGDPMFGDFIRDLHSALDSLQQSIKIFALGIDYRKYMKFKMLTPVATRMVSGEYRVSWERGIKPVFSREHAEFCVNFVLETALILQQFDFERV